MHKGRLEAFSDGVFAIIITIMVLEFKAPSDPNLSALRPMSGAFLSYVLSFTYVAIYWNNHHHMLQASRRVSGRVLWANMHLLFWLSTVPFVTQWMGATGFAPVPVAAYGVALLMAGCAYYLLAQALLACHEPDGPLAKAIGNDRKGKLSLVIYAIAIGMAFVEDRISGALYGLVAAMWLIPDLRIERELTNGKGPHPGHG
ncbi:MAG: TMEM175 family protein [Gemmataceae bacterium]|nr:TMEM175 family protein [Gemmataceae bacterium]